MIAIGIRTLLRRETDAAPDAGLAGADRLEPPRARTAMQTHATLRPSRDVRVAFAHGVVVNVLNPKTALFFLAFLPQFADPALGAVWPQLLVLGTTFVVLGLCTDGAYALVASHLGRWLRTRPSFARRRRHVTAGIYVTLGVGAALGGSAEAKPTGDRRNAAREPASRG